MARKQLTTRKKVKVIGHKEYIDKETGEIKDMQIISIEERDFNFHKVWLQHILNSIDLIGNQKTRLAFWIIENLNKENQLVKTQREIAKETKISLETVRQTLKSLGESNFLQKINSGAYRINPNYIFKGGKEDRLNVLIEYTNTKGEQIAKEMEKAKQQAKAMEKKQDESDSGTNTDGEENKSV